MVLYRRDTLENVKEDKKNIEKEIKNLAMNYASNYFSENIVQLEVHINKEKNTIRLNKKLFDH